uniref:Ras modification protein ERF4 n=1 Tax=Macrostomum lignano TaxID=282301 RepID=A0A1I8FFX7_9PLAT
MGSRPAAQVGHSRKVYIQRDYSQGLDCATPPPCAPQLQDRMPEDLFEAAIILAGAENGSVGVYAESCFACLTGYLIYMCMDTHFERSLKEVRKLIEEYNRTVFMPQADDDLTPASGPSRY